MTTSATALFEIRLAPTPAADPTQAAATWAVRLFLELPGNETLALSGAEPVRVVLPLEQLRSLPPDDPAYGHTLADALFAPPLLHEGLSQTRQTVQRLAAGVQVRVVLLSPSPALQALHWHTLADPLALPGADEPIEVQQRTDPARPAPAESAPPAKQAPDAAPEPVMRSHPPRQSVTIGIALAGMLLILLSLCLLFVTLVIWLGPPNPNVPDQAVSAAVSLYLCLTVLLLLPGGGLLLLAHRRDTRFRVLTGRVRKPGDER